MNINALIILVIIFCPFAFAKESSFDLTHFLQSFRSNSAETMNALPSKTRKVNRRHGLKKKLLVRNQLTTSSSDKSVIRYNDTPQVLLGGGQIEFNIKNMHTLKLQQSKALPNAPWSDDYWPIYKGILGARYANRDYVRIYSWSDAFDYTQENTVESILSRNSPEEVDKLSPSEKYDLVFGLTDRGLTKAMWEEGQKYFDQNGNVETWMGICHGWAPASYIVPRPTNKIQVKALDGRIVNFYPSDIKSLASLLWAKTSTNINFIGGRCNSKDPARDDNGRVTEKDCIDTNPATWHVSIVNKLGIRRESFVFDATFDYEVWNQPLTHYQYKYFNPNEQGATTNLKDALIPIEEFKNDPFIKYRSKDAKYLIGIIMEVEYLVEAPPEQREKETPKYDATNVVHYVYDLELDENYKIIGGEWYQNAHPDFLWTPQKDSRALSDGDFFILGDSHWNGEEKLSDNWVFAASQSARYGQPLAMFVESLIELSNSNKEL